MVVDDPLQVRLIDVRGGLGLVGVVDEVDVATGHARHDFGSLEAEAVEDELRFGSGFALSGGRDVEAALRVEVRADDGGNDAVGVGVLMTENESGHDGILSSMET